MNILFLNWRDIKNPAAGGAEIYTHEVAKRLVQRGHKVTLFCAFFPGAKSEEIIDGVKIIRRGRQWTVHWHAYQWYKKLPTTSHQLHFDLVIDEINTIPFFTPLYVKGAKNIAYINQLARQVWWYEARCPLNIAGYLLEPLYLKVYKNIPVITISQSTKDDLIKYGHCKNNIFICPIGLNIKPVDKLSNKEKQLTLIFIGRLNKSKRPDHVIKAFSLINQKIPQAKLWIIGNGQESYKNKLKKLVKKLNLEEKIKFFGFVPEEKKRKLLQKAHLILVTSVKEGWGLIVTEAASCGTPALVYNVDGLRDSVQDNETGIICKENNPECLSKEVIRLINDKKKYQKLQYNAWRWSKEFSWDKTAKEFIKYIEFVNKFM